MPKTILIVDDEPDTRKLTSEVLKAEGYDVSTANDGADGVKAIKQKGGTIFAQNEETCVVYGMPKAAYLTGCVDRMMSLEHLAAEIHKYR